VIIAMARIPVVAGERCQDRVDGIEDAPEKRPSFPDQSVEQPLVRAVGDQPQAKRFAKRMEFVRVYDPVVYDREGRSAGFAGVLTLKDDTVKPHVKPMRGIPRHQSGKRFGMRRPDQEHSSGDERATEEPDGVIRPWEMLDHVVADDQLEAVGRELGGLNVSQDFLVSIGVVLDLGLIDVDNDD